MSSISSLQYAVSQQRAINNRIQSEVNRVERENRELQSEINMMVNAIRDAEQSITSTISHVNSTLESDKNRVIASNHTLEDSDAIHKKIESQYALFKNMEKAYKEIRSLRNELRYKMGEYDNVKKLVMSVVDNISAKMVDVETLRTRAEKSHLTVKDFYLLDAVMYVLLSQCDAPEAAQRALKYAEKMDILSTHTFLFLYSLCNKDYPTAKKWLDTLPIDMLLRNDEKLMLMFYLYAELDAYKTDYDPLDDRIKEIWDTFCRTHKNNSIDIATEILNWYYRNTVITYYEQANDLPDRRAITFDDVCRSPDKLIEHITENGNCLGLIRKHVSQSSDMFFSLAMANENRVIKALIEQMAGENYTNYYGNYVLYVMSEFIDAASNNTLKDIYNQIKEKEAIIICKGDLAKAKTHVVQEKVEAAKDRSLDDYLYSWLQSTEDFAGKGSVIRSSFIALSRYFKEAYTRYRSFYKSKLSSRYNVSINDYSTVTSFKDEQADVENIKKYYQEEAAGKIAALKRWAYVLTPILFVVFIVAGAVLWGLHIGAGDGIALCIVCFAGALISIIGGLVKFYKNKKLEFAYNEECQKKTTEVTCIMNALYAEYLDAFKKKYDECDAVSEKIYKLV